MEKSNKKAPKHLSHKPIVVVNNYEYNDGKYSAKKINKYSDAKAISIGQSQYDPNEISLKVFRHTGKKWSRQSEELPIHRVFDLAMLALKTMSESAIPNYVDVYQENKLNNIKTYFKNNQEHLYPRIIELRKAIDDFIEGCEIET